MSFRGTQSGFTLIELMVTVLVLGALAALAAPSFSSSIDRARLKSQVAGVVDVFEFAKSEALKRSSVTVNVVGSTAGNSDWSVSAVAVDAANHSETKAVSYSALNGVTLPSTDSAFTIDFRGVAAGTAINSAFTLQSRRGLQVRVTVNPIGGVRVCAVTEPIGEFPVCPS